LTLGGVLVYNQIYIGGIDVQEIKLIRIQKYLSDMGIMSRRAAEKEIERGNVTVNGIRAKVGDKIDPANDALLLNGKPIAEQNKKYYIHR
jgi:23S rRNA pseudouridine2604 synthase